MYLEEELTVVAGYECPKVFSPQTKRVLRKLRITGVIVFQHDDGPAVITHEQLVEVANSIGLDYYQTRYKVVLIDSDVIKPINGAIDVRDGDFPELSPE